MASPLLPQETIRAKRDGQALSRAQIDDFVQGLASGRWADAQVAALAMAVLLRGMDTAETVALTQAMAASGQRLRWADFPGPVLDKHSSGGVGDKVSLVLAPLLAACGALVPMLSGRGLGHTGGTLDKLQALPGYQATPDDALMRSALRQAGCAIVGASAQVAPADRRLYAIRDVTATVESVPLITASILSKKLAAGTQALVMDVKCGNGAFCTTLPQAQALAQSIVSVAHGAGLPTRALITDMNQVLGHSAGNALEVAEALDCLTGRPVDARLLALTLDLAAQALHMGGLATTLAEGEAKAQRALASGAAAECFARMVAALGGPADVLRQPQLPTAPVQRALPAPRAGVLVAMDTRALGLAVVGLGGGRAHPDDVVDPRVGLDQVLALGSVVAAGQPVLVVHAASQAAADAACAALATAFTWADSAVPATPLVLAQVGGP